MSAEGLEQRVGRGEPDGAVGAGPVARRHKLDVRPMGQADLEDGAERDRIWDIDAVRILLLRDHGTAAGDVELRVQ